MIDHSYFSGKKNIDSMKIEYQLTNNELYGEFKPKKTHVSYNHVVHGGLIAAILDDAMAYHINRKDIIAYTAKIELTYKKPLKIGTSYTIKSTITQLRKKFILTEGRIEDESRNILVTAKAIFIRDKS